MIIVVLDQYKPNIVICYLLTFQKGKIPRLHHFKTPQLAFKLKLDRSLFQALAYSNFNNINELTF